MHHSSQVRAQGPHGGAIIYATLGFMQFDQGLKGLEVT